MTNLIANYHHPKHPGSLGGIKRFYHHNQNRLKDLASAREVLEASDVYTVNKPVRRRFERNRTIVTNLRQQYQADLIDLKKYKNENDGVQYILIVIDCFSKKAFAYPLKDKTGKEVHAGLIRAFKELGEPEKLQTDKGREFFNKSVSDFLAKLHIHHFTSENEDIKCSIAERFIRTLKTRIWHLFRHRVATRYIDQLRNIIDAYNNTPHSAHGLAPNEVSQQNSLAVYNRLSGKKRNRKKPPRFKVGDYVRLAKKKHIMEKGYEYKFTEEVFVIRKVIPHAVPMYQIKNLLGQPYAGKFYEAELVLVRGYDPNKSFIIDKVLQRKGNRIKVRWLGYGPEHDSWIDKSCLNTHPST